ncbi:uncharacterized [Tachysurus ichikawai]
MKDEKPTSVKAFFSSSARIVTTKDRANLDELTLVKRDRGEDRASKSCCLHKVRRRELHEVLTVSVNTSGSNGRIY